MKAVSGRFSRNLFCLAAACACAGTAAAAPAVPVVSAGSASYNPATLTVTSTSAHTQISWPSFNVAAGEVLRFIQPNAQSVVLNQVFDPQSLNILGGVSSNGSVYFMSNGRLAGPGVNLDLAGAISTSLRLPRLALALGGDAPQGRTRALTTLAEGSIYVISEDERAVTRANGEVVLNPGKTVELAHAAMLHLRVELTAPDSAAINLSRLVGEKHETGIFAGLFRIPAAARQATQRDADTVLTASVKEPAPVSADMQRFYRYVQLYAQLRREVPRHDGGLMQVAAASGSRTLVSAKSRPSLLPRDIEIGAHATRLREPAFQRAAAEMSAATPEPQPIPVAANSEPERGDATLLALLPAAPAPLVTATLEPQPIPTVAEREPERSSLLALAYPAPAIAVVATLEPQLVPAAVQSDAGAGRATLLALAPVPPEAETVATLEPRPVMVATESEPERDRALLLALAPAQPAAEVVATLEPQPIAAREAQEPAELRLLARQLAAAQPVQVAHSHVDAAHGGHDPQPANTVIVVALSQHHSAAAVPAEDSQPKEIRIERRAPRYFTDYRGAMFFM